MAELEICQIIEIRRPVGFLSETAWWEAHQVTLQGAVTIARSEFKIPGFLSSLASREEAYEEQRQTAHSQLIAQLVAQGWEPTGTSGEGLISVMKRLKS
jgi:hypothetical protein